MSAVYGICDGTATKIGVTGGGKGRLMEMQTGNPNRLHEVLRIPCADRRTAFVLERLIHSHLADERLQGEWFWGNCILDVGRL